jgi:hypothetical protein
MVQIEQGPPDAAAVDRSLSLYVVVVLLLNTIGLSVVAIQRYALHAKYPRNTLLYDPLARFKDFTSSEARVRHLGDPRMLSSREYGGEGYEVFPYPVPAVYPHLFFNLFSNPIGVYFGMIIVAALASATILSLKLKASSGDSQLSYLVVSVTLLTPFPLLFLFDRGNLEGFIWILIVFGVFLFYRGSYYCSAVILAAAASMKIFPALLFLLFIAKRKYWPFAAAVGTVVTITVLCWAGVGPTVRQAALDSSLSGRMLNDIYIVGFRPWEIGWDHSLMALLKQMLYVLARLRHLSHDPSRVWIQVPGVQTATAIYGVLAPLLFAILYWRRLYRLPVLNQLIAFLVLSVLLPFVSNEYTLVHLYVAWGALLLFLYQDVRRGRFHLENWKVSAMLSCFAVIFSPQSYWVFGYADTVGGQIKTVAMLALLGLVSAFPMPSSGLADLERGGPTTFER